MERFSGTFHQSDLKSYLKCPRAFFYGRVLGLDKEKVSMAALAGRAGHNTMEMAHLKKEWRPTVLFDHFCAKLADKQTRAREKGQAVHGKADLDWFRSMLTEYAAKPWNREAEVIAMEQGFYFTIKPAKTEYAFEGRIDQLLRIPTDALVRDFPMFRDINKNSVVIHRDTKTGDRRESSRFELALDVQFDVYAYALRHGVFFDQSDDGEQGLPAALNIIPDFHAKYFTADHIPYKDDKGAYLQDANGGRVPCDLVAKPCLVGKTQKPCEGKRSYCTKQSRGPGMYFTVRPEGRLKQIPAELGRVCASIRMGHYPRHLGQLCFSYCQFRSTCEGEVMTEMGNPNDAAAADRAVA